MRIAPLFLVALLVEVGAACGGNDPLVPVNEGDAATSSSSSGAPSDAAPSSSSGDSGPSSSSSSGDAGSDAAASSSGDAGEHGYGQPCVQPGTAGDCAAELTCADFPAQNRSLCTHECTKDVQCEPPATKCNGQGVCVFPQ